MKDRQKKLLIVSLTLAVLTGIAIHAYQRFTRNPERGVANTTMAPPPPWTLNLNGPYQMFEVPSVDCLQREVERIADENAAGAYQPKSAKLDPRLVEKVIKTASAYQVDPMIFLALLYQESGNFVADATNWGTGVAQMTNVAIKDACYALEGTDCKRPFANPEHGEIWSARMKDAITALYDTSMPEEFYPWRRHCAKNVATRCRADCGLTPDCFARIKKSMITNDNVSLTLGGLTFMNFVGVARLKKMKSLSALYQEALRQYNGHPKNMKAYPGKVFKKLAALRAACPFDQIKN